MNTYAIIDVVKDLLTGELKFVTRQAANQRSNICSVCEARNSVGVCTACGCVIKWKVKLQKSSCPMELW